MMDDLTPMRSARRREGFPGQRQCVLPPDIVTRSRRHPLLAPLLPTDAGFYPRAAGHYVERRHGAAGTVLLVCREGRGWVRWHGVRAAIGAGGVVLLPPEEPHAYGADARAPWTLEWAHFTGGEAAAWRDLVLARADGCAAGVPANRVGEIGLVTVCEQLEAGYSELQLLAAAAALRGSLAALARLSRLPAELAPAFDAVDASAAWIRQNLDRRITLPDLARRACLSPSHYSAVFRRRFGYAPIDWVLRQRVQRACALLRSSPDKVSVIARAVGVTDPYYFSRLFRRVMGVPPRAFRG